MATASNLVLIDSTKQQVLLGASSIVIIENVASGVVRWAVDASSTIGGSIKPGDSIKIDYDIQVWNEATTEKCSIQITRN